MDTELVYLRPNVQVEPLVDQWYAWSQLLSPATAARNVTERHLKIMDSYLSAPELHAAAVKNPKMLGGPFIDYDGGRVDDIRALRDRVRNERTAQIELSNALVELDGLLKAKAKGFGLQPLYAEVPQALRGYVELVYDLSNQASFRLLEPLLFKSRYHDTALQSVMLSMITGDDRPFVLSTPRLEGDHTFHWRVAFHHEAIDEFFRLKSSPQPYGAIREFAGATGESEAVFRDLFDRTPPQRYERYTGPLARWRYFGHACVLVESPSTSLLFDPVLSYTYESQVSRYTYADLPDMIDFVLVTHNHQDHVLFETLLQLRHKVRQIVVPKSSGALQDPSLKRLLEHAGFTNVIEIGEMEEIRFTNGVITALPFFGEHSDLNITCKSAYHVRLGSRSIIFAADSCNFEPRAYEHVHRDIGDVDVLFLGMECVGAPLTWLYGPLLPAPIDRAMDLSRRLAGSNYEQALDLVERFRCREVYVYAMGQEPWLNYVMCLKYTEQSKPIVESNKLLAECRARGIAAERLFGERTMFLEPASRVAAAS